jgi:hypothetical protein
LKKPDEKWLFFFVVVVIVRRCCCKFWHWIEPIFLLRLHWVLHFVDTFLFSPIGAICQISIKHSFLWKYYLTLFKKLDSWNCF